MRLLSALLFCAVLQTALWISQAEASAAERPNVLVILADDLGIGDITAYSAGAAVATPFISELAASGVRFTDAHAHTLRPVIFASLFV